MFAEVERGSAVTSKLARSAPDPAMPTSENPFEAGHGAHSPYDDVWRRMTAEAYGRWDMISMVDADGAINGECAEYTTQGAVLSSSIPRVVLPLSEVGHDPHWGKLVLMRHRTSERIVGFYV